MSGDVAKFVEQKLGHKPRDLALFERALTHSSVGGDSYERLEFLGDRVLGLTIARALYERYPTEPEGKLSRRYNALVARETCAEIGYEHWASPPSSASASRPATTAPTRATTSSATRSKRCSERCSSKADWTPRNAASCGVWAPYLEGQGRAPHHPKSALQELAAARDWKGPHYELVSRTGAHHAPLFTVKVSIPGVGEAQAEGSSKQEAETAAADALLAQLQ